MEKNVGVPSVLSGRRGLMFLDVFVWSLYLGKSMQKRCRVKKREKREKACEFFVKGPVKGAIR